MRPSGMRPSSSGSIRTTDGWLSAPYSVRSRSTPIIVGEYRVVRPDGTERWIAARGRVSDTGRAQTRMLGVSVEITDRKRAELALEERLRFEQLLTDLSAKFINQPPDRIDGVIGDSLKRLLEALDHDRSSLAQFSQDTGQALVTHSCAVPGVEPFPVGVSVDDYLPWYVGEVRNGKTLFLRFSTG